MHHVSALLVSLVAVFVSSCNFPPQQLAAHIWTTFLSNILFYQPMEMTNDPLLANYMERRMSVFTQKMSTFDFQLHQRCQLRRARFYLAFIFKKYAQNQRIKFPMAKTEKRTWHWNGQIGEKIGKKQPVVIGLSALFIRPVTFRCRPDIISLRKHWSRDLFQKHKRLWLEQGCHSQS